MLSTNHTTLTFTLLILLLVSCSMSNVTAKVKQPLHHVSATECKTCHEQIYVQWKGSIARE